MYGFKEKIAHYPQMPHLFNVCLQVYIFQQIAGDTPYKIFFHINT